VDFPIKNGGSFNSYVKLPEGTSIPIYPDVPSGSQTWLAATPRGFPSNHNVWGHRCGWIIPTIYPYLSPLYIPPLLLVESRFLLVNFFFLLVKLLFLLVRSLFSWLNPYVCWLNPYSCWLTSFFCWWNPYFCWLDPFFSSLNPYVCWLNPFFCWLNPYFCWWNVLFHWTKLSISCGLDRCATAIGSELSQLLESTVHPEKWWFNGDL
jgi:hypothetical protein